MSASIGQRLKQEREARRLTLEKASEDTRIRVVFLRALEADDYSLMPSAAQGRGFLRNYADYLGLNLDELIEELRRAAPSPELSGPLPQVNLAETEAPIELEAEPQPARSFLTGWLARLKRDSATPEVESAPRETETQPEAPPPPREEIPSAASEESRANLFSKIKAFFPARPHPQANERESAAPAASEPPTPADQIFAEIGRQLREQRELISLTVEEVERHTKLRAAFIRALEAGQHRSLPSPVQTRGMLASYANFLDLNEEALLLRFAEGLQARRREKYADVPRGQIQMEVHASLPLWRVLLTGDVVFGLAMIIALFGLALWGINRALTAQEQVVATAPAISDVLMENIPTQAPVGVTFVPVEEKLATPTVEAAAELQATPTFGSAANIAVELFALERVFVRVSVDGKVAFEGRLLPREARLFEGNQQVVVLAGNGAALRARYNGEDLGLMGNPGEVVNRVYLITGVATPTATVSPTPTNTPNVTPTFTPTQTPSFTPPPP